MGNPNPLVRERLHVKVPSYHLDHAHPPERPRPFLGIAVSAKTSLRRKEMSKFTNSHAIMFPVVHIRFKFSAWSEVALQHWRTARFFLRQLLKSHSQQFCWWSDLQSSVVIHPFLRAERYDQLTFSSSNCAWTVSIVMWFPLAL